MNSIRSFFLFLVCISSSLDGLAQKDFPHDTAYYETFPDKFTVRLYLSKKYVHLNFPSGGSAENLEYKANPKLGLGAGITIKNFSINLFNGFGFLNPKNDPKGKTKGFDFQIHAYPRKWSIDLLYLSPKGYHLGQKGAAGVGPDEYYYRGDLRQQFSVFQPTGYQTMKGSLTGQHSCKQNGRRNQQDHFYMAGKFTMM